MGISKSALFDEIYKKGLYSDFVDFSIYMKLTKNYSLFNSALILLQKPGATYIESEDIWNNRYDRHVLPDARPIIIMQPFGPVKLVYDYSDTVGDNVPQMMRDSFNLPKADYAIGKRLPDLIYMIKKLGIYYGESDFGVRLGGCAEYREKAITFKFIEAGKEVSISTHLSITVNKNSSDESKATAILHEIGHILCGHLPGDKENRRIKTPDRCKENLSKEQVEIEAEKVCELICKTLEYGYDNEDYKNSYMINGIEPYFSVRYVIEAADKFINTYYGNIK